MKITDLKSAIIGTNIVLRVMTDKGIDGYAELNQLLRTLQSMNTRLQETVEKLQHKSAELESIIDHMLNGLIAVDGQLHVVQMNNAAKHMLGVTGAEKAEPARIFMHGQPTFKFAVQAVPYCIDQVLQRSGKTMDDVDFFVFHQANARIIDLAVRKYHIPPEKYYKNIQKYGNTSAASIPLVISELHDLGKVGPGSRVLVVGFGGGLTWGGALIEFA